jgi:hypothetical protein
MRLSAHVTVTYPRTVYRFAALTTIGVAFVGCGGASPRTTHEPPWVVSGVKVLRAYFRGTPKPTAVTWGRNPTKKWVMIVFHDTQTCVLCHGGPRGFSNTVTGRRATITWYTGSGPHRFGISIQKH